jgi:hypothetical protein
LDNEARWFALGGSLCPSLLVHRVLFTPPRSPGTYFPSSEHLESDKAASHLGHLERGRAWIFRVYKYAFHPESSPQFLNGIAIVPAIATTVLMPEQAPLDNVVPATTLGLDAAPALGVVRPKRRWTWSMGMRRADIENQDQEREPTGPGELCAQVSSSLTLIINRCEPPRGADRPP